MLGVCRGIADQVEIAVDFLHEELGLGYAAVLLLNVLKDMGLVACDVGPYLERGVQYVLKASLLGLGC